MLGSNKKEGRELLFFIVPLILFFSALLIVNLHVFNDKCHPEGDHALTALSVERASEQIVWSGPYSRSGVRHPSPVLFYYYATTRWIFDPFTSTAGALSAAAFLLNSFCLLAGLFVFRRMHSEGAMLFAAILISVLPFTINSVFFDTWGPAAIVLPFFLFFISSSAVAAGHSSGLILQSIAAVIVTGTHFGTLPIVAVIYSFSLIKFFCDSGVNKKDQALKLSLSFLVLFSGYFLPVLRLILKQEQSELYQLLAFAFTEPIQQSLLEAFGYVGGFYRLPFRRFLPAPEIVLVTVLVLLLLLRTKDIFFTRLKTILLLTITFSVIAAMKIDIARFRYVMWWHVPVVAFFFYYLLIPVLFTKQIVILNPLKNRVVQSFIFVVTFLLVLPGYEIRARKCTDFYVGLVDMLPCAEDLIYTVMIAEPEVWKPVAGSVLSLYRADCNVCVYDWEFMFEDSLQCRMNKGGFEKSVRLTFFDKNKKLPAPEAEARQFLHRKAVVVIKPEKKN